MAGWQPISGETPIDDISGLIPKKTVKSRAELNAVEAENIRQAIVQYLSARPSRRQAPFTPDWCYKLHAQMFGRVWRWAGSRRQVELNIGVPFHRIEIEMKNLMDDLEYWRERAGMDALEQTARLHHRAVQIHPFLNGNGRWARLLANIRLKQSANTVTMWPEETVGDASIIRGEYISALHSADAGQYERLIALHRRLTQL